MKPVFCSLLLSLIISLPALAQEWVVRSPDARLAVHLHLDDGKLSYSVFLDEEMMLAKSPLGLTASTHPLSEKLHFVLKHDRAIDEQYSETRFKKSHIRYQANELVCRWENSEKQAFETIFQVSNNDVAFRYFVPQQGEQANIVVQQEHSGFHFPARTTTFLTPQSPPMVGWKKTKPSYEEDYTVDAPLGAPSQYGVGFTFPALFKIEDKGWVLLSETGVDGNYCGSKLSEPTSGGLYSIAFPEQGENNGLGAVQPAFALPGFTPWRTLTVGKTLQPILETTITQDVVGAKYKPSMDYAFGRSTWSWLEWQDESINLEDQKKFVNLSAAMGYEYTLVDNWWDTKIGRDKIAELAAYAEKKRVGLLLWYNSNGYWNDAPQGPKNKMNQSIQRKEEMAWMKELGIKGIKVDFFGGDKQETMQLYEAILSDANDHGLGVIFHGCTLPRGWERMYPNFISSEAVLASENLIFTQRANDMEAFNATLHPFIRNSVAAMDFGPVLLNKRHNRTNSDGTIRKTSEAFQIATAVVFQSAIQNFGITPNNLTDASKGAIEFMKSVPTTWDETLFLDGYPGKYVVLARRKGSQWYIAGINAEPNPKTVELSLPMISNRKLLIYSDDASGGTMVSSGELGEDQRYRMVIPTNGGVLLVGE
ncbi:glycoside hydrolase family 97 protein [Sphingobacterium sp. lm-10]|uniref:glycoside hydrolase family 97 protein n=1 Tax=Sphingobacterium sp. lm-10 TaxID=2944904 RepID=UPI002021A5BD|nr:glycoside hydrolase family 97 protein [Sphingobacterium sp. lm-10]MCL7986708.1 glycoside hydrolase family 97 protein [Sphingobacterium sp. lm-10]